jgi:hypothetical protein
VAAKPASGCKTQPHFAATAGAIARESSDYLNSPVRNTSIVPHISRNSWQLGRSLALPNPEPRTQFWNFSNSPGKARIQPFLERGVCKRACFFRRAEKRGVTMKVNFGTWNRVRGAFSKIPKFGSGAALPAQSSAGASPSRTLNPAFYSNPNVPAGGTSMPVRRVTLRFGRNRGSMRKLKLTLPFD